MQLNAIPFVGSPHFTNASRTKVDLVVIHTAETPETLTSAEATANYFRTTAREVSAHYCVDANSVVQCVKLEDVAWAAPGANHDGIQIELAGRAAQTPAQWSDAFSKRELDLAAELVAKLCEKYAIPVVRVESAGLVGGRRGITTHADVSRAFHRSTHWDPGSGFPMAAFLSSVRRHGAGPFEPPVAVKDPLRTIRVGSKGWEVTKAQKLLVGAHFLASSEVDGIFGPKTKAAVVAFQKSRRLTADGIIGPSTWSALLLSGSRP